MLLSCQLYTVRELAARDLKGTLQALKAMGLNAIEGAAGHGLSTEAWKDLVGEVGLRVTGGHVGFEELARSTSAVAEHAKALGYTSVVVPWAAAANYPGGWATVAELLELFGRQLRMEGLSLGYHNHAHELRPGPDGEPALEFLFARTDPALVRAQLDLGWVHFGGGDPAALVRKFANRLDSVHLKDAIRGERHVDVVAGHGEIDWDAALGACFEVGCPVGVLEMDEPPGDALRAVEASVEFYLSKGVLA